MPEAANTPTTSRRNALRFGAGAALSSLHRPAIAAGDGDAALLDLCRQFDAYSLELHRCDNATAAQCAADPTLLGDDGALVPLINRWDDAIERITAIQATTMAGIRAKAGALRHALPLKVREDSVESFEDQADDHELLAMSLVRDLAGEVHA